MLRVAVPNKGLLAAPARDILAEAGYRQRGDERDLVAVDAANDVEFFYLRPRDVATYVGAGTLDLGITGRDYLLDSGAAADEVLALDIGASTLRFAAVPGTIDAISDLAGRRVATALPHLVASYLRERDVPADVVRLDGAVETAIRLGVADAVADVVSSGLTLRQAGLVPFGEPIITSEAVVLRPTESRPTESRPALDAFLRRLQGVLVARRYVLMDYDVRADALEAACRLTPGYESPTVSPLADTEWCAVRSMVPRSDAQQVMDDLWAVGARAILVTDIHACRL
jgi:ATP phosphoribosyltransferase